MSSEVRCNLHKSVSFAIKCYQNLLYSDEGAGYLYGPYDIQNTNDKTGRASIVLLLCINVFSLLSNWKKNHYLHFATLTQRDTLPKSVHLIRGHKGS